MTPTQYKKMLASELKRINERIDFKILQGERYRDDSKRHRELLRKFQRQRKKVRQGLFSKLLPSLTIF